MLRHAPGAAARLRRAVDSATALAAEQAAIAPRRFGRYDVVREIGRGGMGVVYEGVSDDEFRRRVAIKVAPHVGDLFDARFKLERRILAGLEHPLIARFLDAGSEGGQPYFVMEFVDGVPITEHCRQRGLDVDARLALVGRVCGVLGYAHQHLVVHRDLKPSNILVTADGTPKLLDFGIAKLLDREDDTAATLGLVAWTPDYASPEQVSGRAISTRSDVYSLGLVLYEVLTGTRGQIADRSSALALTRSVCEQEPPAPSVAAAVAGQPALARRLRGDLDAIVLTAIRKEPDRRYASIGELADDLQRVTDGLPVRATPSTWRYRAGKWLSRHRAVTSAATIAIVSLLVGAGVAVYQWRRAERRFDQVRALANAFVFDVNDRIQSLPGATDARRAIVQTAVTYLENLRQDAASDPGLAKELAAAYLKIGDVQGHPQSPNLGDPDAALASYERADLLLTPLDRRGDRAATMQMATIAMQRGQVLMGRGDAAGGAAALEQARILGERVQASGGNPESTHMLGNVFSELSRNAFGRGDAAQALDFAQRAMAIAEQRLAEALGGPQAPEARDGIDRQEITERRDDVATASNAVGAARMASGEPEEALRVFRRSTELREAIVRSAPDQIDYRHNLMISYGNMADALAARVGLNLGDVAGARDALTKALALANATLAADPNDHRAMADVVQIESRLGSLETPPRDATTDLTHLEVADRLVGQLVTDQPANANFALLQALVHRRMGIALAVLGRTAEAERRYVRARQGARQLLESPVVALNARQSWIQSDISLARLYADIGDRRAQALADEAAAALREKPFDPKAAVAPQYVALARVYLDLALRASTSTRPTFTTAAREFLDKGEAAWREARLASAIESQRTDALSAIAADRVRIGQ